MKQLIEDYFNLATEYVAFGKEVKLQKTHNDLGEVTASILKKKANELPINMKVYFANDYDIWAVYFDKKLEILGYSYNSIKMPIDWDIDKHKKILSLARNNLSILKSNKISVKKWFNNKRKEEIRKLMKQLSELNRETF